jgi:hypothetical protein
VARSCAATSGTQFGFPSRLDAQFFVERLPRSSELTSDLCKRKLFVRCLPFQRFPRLRKPGFPIILLQLFLESVSAQR